MCRGYPLDKAIELCKGVIVDATPDFEIKENDTYQPGVRISNYVCYPGGGVWVRWDHTKENDYIWSNRVEPCRDGNSPEVPSPTPALPSSTAYHLRLHRISRTCGWQPRTRQSCNALYRCPVTPLA